MDVRHNIAIVRKSLDGVRRDEIPFTVSLALNEVVKGAAVHMTRRMARVLDRPVAFTRNSIRPRLSSKRKWEAAVFVTDRQAEYLQWQENGGTRQPKGRAVVVPFKMRLNSAGNMPKGAIKRALARKNTFASKAGDALAPGIYQRIGGKRRPGLRMLAAFEDDVTYTGKPLAFRETIARFVASRLPGALARAAARAGGGSRG